MAPTKTAKKQSFTPEERAAMKARAQEAKAAATRAEGEKICLAAIKAMPEPDRGLAKKIHDIVTSTAPDLAPKTWYGMPAYANSDEKVVCYVKPAAKFKQRYLQFGFEDAAALDDGAMWPVVFAITELKPADEKKIAALVKKAAR